MNRNDHFDELARRKLEEQAFPFDEGAWQGAQQAITAKRRKRRGPWYLLGLIPLAFIAWMLWPTTEPVGEQVSIQPSAQHTASSAPVKEATATSTQQSRAATIDHSAQAAPALHESNTERIPAEDQKSDDAEQPIPVEAKPSYSAKSDTPIAIGSLAIDAHPAEAEDVADNPSSTVQDPMPDDDAAMLADQTTDAVDAEAPLPLPIVEILHEQASEPTDSPQEDVPVSEVGTETAVPDDVSAASEPIAQLPHPSPSDSMPTDSILAEAPPPIAPPLIATRSPWELNALFGAQATNSRYSSPHYADLTTTPELGPAFGAELMRMGRNVGFGFGLHHSTYADRLTVPEQRTTAFEVNRTWFLQTVDTTVLIITGGDPINGYTGINVPITTQVLLFSFDTAVTVSVRTAREHVVRTSYLELPLLLDAHLVQGRWSFGVRGGPSIGLLTTRSGTFPSEGESPAQVRDSDVRQWSVGWMARAYVRYRFNSAWSVGIEPMMRGQLIDAIDGPVVTRRSDAYGVLLGLGYRLR
ncbi:MAG: hypothetical protein IPM46_11770 [Flavobacteriales bacterium]|nr:hypothetical protein [Flavobacteriales bacterium]